MRNSTKPINFHVPGAKAKWLYWDIFGEELSDKQTDEFNRRLKLVLPSLKSCRRGRAICLRYYGGLTYREIGNLLGVSLERARQIVLKSLKMLAHRERGIILGGKPMTKKMRNDWGIGQRMSANG